MLRYIFLITISACPVTPTAAQTPFFFRMEADGEVAIVNTSAEPQSFDGYSISCEPGCLDPEGWVSIQDSALADTFGVIGALAPEA